MDFLYQLQNSRLDLLQQTNEIAEQVLQVKGDSVNFQHIINEIKRSEKSIQIHENDHLQVLQSKKEYTKQERTKFHRIMQQAIVRLCPHINSQLLMKYQPDGKNHNICMIFLQLFTHFSIADRVNEIKTICDNKLYKQIPLLYVLMKWFIQASRKVIGQQLRFISHQQNRGLTQRILESCNSSIDETRNAAFLNYVRNIKQAVPDVDIQEIPPQHFVATIKYRALFIRNLKIKQNLDKFRQPGQSQSIFSTRYLHLHEWTPKNEERNKSLEFYFQYYYNKKSANGQSETKPKSSTGTSSSLQSFSKRRIPSVSNESTILPQKPPFNDNTQISVRITQFPSLTNSVGAIKQKVNHGFKMKAQTPLKNLDDSKNSISLNNSLNDSWIQQSFVPYGLDSLSKPRFTNITYKKSPQNKNFFFFDYEKKKLDFTPIDKLYIIYEKKKKILPYQPEKIELISKGQKIESSVKPIKEKKKKIPSKLFRELIDDNFLTEKCINQVTQIEKKNIKKK